MAHHWAFLRKKLGKVFCCEELKSGELLTIDLNYDSYGRQETSYFVQQYNTRIEWYEYFFARKVSETKDFIEKANGGKEP